EAFQPAKLDAFPGQSRADVERMDRGVVAEGLRQQDGTVQAAADQNGKGRVGVIHRSHSRPRKCREPTGAGICLPGPGGKRRRQEGWVGTRNPVYARGVRMFRSVLRLALIALLGLLTVTPSSAWAAPPKKKPAPVPRKVPPPKRRAPVPRGRP